LPPEASNVCEYCDPAKASGSGDEVVIVGAELAEDTTNTRGVEVPPPGEGLRTPTLASVGEAISLAEIKAVMSEVGATKTIIAIYFRQPFVLDEASGLKNAGAILAHFSVSDIALMDVLSGKFKPRGKLPFALANSLQAVLDNDPDVPGYPAHDTLYPFGFGLRY